MTINDQPVTASQIIVLARYPEAKSDLFADGEGDYHVILNGNTLVGFGSTIAQAWENAAEVISKGVRES